MDKYEKLAEAFDMEELEERIEFHSCEIHALLSKLKAWCNKAEQGITGQDGCT